MDEISTDEIRALVPQWSLAGDDKLLTLLQNTHQKILSRSEEVNAKLEVMVAGLDNATISLQNVNNKFMALSNSQFIESRVYDDDEDIAKETKSIQEPSVPSAESEVTMIKNSLSVLESMHDMVTILRDSDTESDSDDDAVPRVVMKPKDLYAHRPLPYIIGSQAWKNKWHAGLLVEDSDTDSSTSKPDRVSEQYSDSEPEPERDLHTDTLNLPDRTISETSSVLMSEQDTPTPVAPVLPSPADIAAQLARRLGGHLPHMVEQAEVPESVAQKPTVRTVYRPHQPTPGTIFSDEPPPIDNYESSSSEEEGDIFAELHKKQPYRQSTTDNSRVTEDLFDFSNKNEGDIFSDFATTKVPIPSVKPKSTLYEADTEPELFAPKPDPKPSNKAPTDSNTSAVKKPVGGISLFGSNKGAESIGAAILKRNQRKSSSNDENESDEPSKPQTKTESKPKTIEPAKPDVKIRQTIKPVKKEKDIFDDLFAKSEKLQKKEIVDKDKKVDLFSDNLFDDMDDIFTTNIVKTNTKTDKPIFDVDEDLFADITVSKTINNNDKKKENRGLFDSDDDLFAETTENEPIITKVSDKHETNESDSESPTMTSKVKAEAAKVTLEQKIQLDKSKIKDTEAVKIRSTDESRKNLEDNKQLNNSKGVEITKQAKSIFDDESSDNDIFSSSKSPEPRPTKLQEKEHPNPGFINTVKAVNDKAKETSTNHKVVEITKNPEITEQKIKDTDEVTIQSNDESRKNIEKNKQLNKSKDVEVTKQARSIFDDDSSDNDIFSSLKTPEPKPTKLPEKEHLNTGIINIVKAVNDKAKDSVLGITKKTEVTKVIKESKSIFDEDSDSDIFANIKTTPKNTEITQSKHFLDTDQSNNINHNKATDNLKLPLNSPSLFDDDDEELFAKSKESIIVKKVTLDVKEDSISNILQPSQVVKPTVTQENNNKTDIFNTKMNKPSDIVETIPEHNDLNPISNETVIKNIADIPKVIETSVEPPFEIQSKVPLADEEIESKTREPDIFNDDVAAPDPVNNNEEETLFAAKKDSALIKPDIFSNIFTEPPAFEKIKEPKESQNVNALFGDDSDDEALFFKKDDAISDDKPDIFVPNANTDMFGIFVDEPPAIDVTKSDLNDGIFDSNDYLFQSTTPQEVVSKKDRSVPKNIETQAEKDKELPKSIFGDTSSESDKIDGAQAMNNENKKVGKLKAMNFKIDVNALLPGGSPKKKLIEQVDGQVMSVSNEELPTDDDKVESKMVKSVSFEGSPDSEVLDNKLSKERAKIQVKRRPSTRRARREAVRKSVIDLDNDSTDNSSSIDDLPKSRSVLKTIENKLESNIDKTENDPIRNVKSKVVYILNDEDIFDTKPDVQTAKEEAPKLNIVNSNKSHKTEIFQPRDITDGITTLGSVYKDSPTATAESLNSNGKSKESQAVKAKSLFGELSEDDDELFSKNKATVKKTFESDDDDLFTGKIKNKIKKESVEKKREVIVKGSLFGDDGDDDLFMVKNKTISDPLPHSSKQSSKSTTSREQTKATEPVFDDPLSMLEEDY